MKKVVIIGTPHGKNVPGKCSEDKSYYEYRYGRELAMGLKLALEEDGYTVMVDWTADIVPDNATDELKMRCGIVNAVCDAFGVENCIYVSMHSNASQNGEARGWCVYTSQGQTKSDKLATCLWNAAKDTIGDKMKIRADMTDGDPDYEAGLYVLRHTKCAAVLTENLFHDNREDREFLMSDEGYGAIVELHRRGIKAYLGAPGT